MKIIILLFILTSSAFAGLVFTYRCGVCGMYEKYAFPGIYRCTKDGGAMVPVGNQPFQDCK